MIRLPSFTLLAANTARSKAYIQCMARAGLLPGSCIMVATDPDTLLREAEAYVPVPEESPFFHVHEPLLHTLIANQVPYEFVVSDQVNSEEVIAAVGRMNSDIVIYSGFGGQILKKPVLSLGKRFLHIHPGVVPAYRGSTTVYYSLLRENRVGASAIFLDEQIDCGPLLLTRWFDVPSPFPDMDYVFDPYVRASVLVEVLQRYLEHGMFPEVPQGDVEGETFYIIHPVLKHIAILGGQERD